MRLIQRLDVAQVRVPETAGLEVTASFCTLVRTALALGRTFTEGDCESGRLSAAYFCRKYAAIGKPAKQQGDSGSPREAVEKRQRSWKRTDSIPRL
jgi:hypothetical protein